MFGMRIYTIDEYAETQRDRWALEKDVHHLSNLIANFTLTKTSPAKGVLRASWPGIHAAPSDKEKPIE